MINFDDYKLPLFNMFGELFKEGVFIKNLAFDTILVFKLGMAEP